MTAVTVTISQYGDYIRGSDLVETQAIDNVLAETAELMGELFAQGKPLKFGESLSETTASQARYSYREGVETRRGALRPIGRNEGRVRTAWRHAEAAEMTARLGTLMFQGHQVTDQNRWASPWILSTVRSFNRAPTSCTPPQPVRVDRWAAVCS